MLLRQNSSRPPRTERVERMPRLDARLSSPSMRKLTAQMGTSDRMSTEAVTDGSTRRARPNLMARLHARVRTFFARLAWLLAPIIATALVVLVLIWLKDWEYARTAVVVGLMSFLFLGTSVVLGDAVLDDQIHLFGMSVDVPGTWDLAYIVMWTNAASAFFYAFNIDLLERLPLIGPLMRDMRANATQMLEGHRWLRRLSTVGVGLFVVLPVPGSGSLGGAIVGRLLGVSKRATFLAVTLAGVIVCLGYAVAARWLATHIADVSTPVRVSVAVLAYLVLLWCLRKIYRGGSGATPQPPRPADNEPSSGP